MIVLVWCVVSEVSVRMEVQTKVPFMNYHHIKPGKLRHSSLNKKHDLTLPT